MALQRDGAPVSITPRTINTPLSDNARTKMAPISPRKIRILESAVHHAVNQA